MTPAADRRNPHPPYRRLRVVRARLGLAGCALAIVFFCASLTPSLLPRPVLLQGVVSGLTATMGYATGAALGAVVRRFRRHGNPRAARIGWGVVFVAGPVLGLVFLALGTGWQQELRARVGLERMVTYDILRIVGVSVLTFVLLLLLGRSLRLATRQIARQAGRFLPKPVAYGTGFAIVTLLAVGFVDGFAQERLLDVADRTASITDGGTDAAARRPVTGLRSGGPGSAAPWDTLGRQGRTFVGTGPAAEDLSAFTGTAAAAPIRLYAGLRSAGSARERAQLLVREMDRTGAWSRAAIAVIVPTGTGWVDSAVTDSLEYMYGGDTALVSMQYSYLPSWISFLTDRSKVRETATELIGAVRERWAAMPPRTRPQLLLSGESLGSYGAESAFAGLSGLTGAADGVLLVGPPFANPIHRHLTDTRAAGSPVWNPVPTGPAVRFAHDPADLRTTQGPRPRVVYLQNASDPIVWWTPGLLLSRPVWLEHPRGPDVSPDMRWYPGVTFWQTLVDQFAANGVPAGHGHVYGSGPVDGWAAVAAPPGWTTADTVRLRAHLDSRS
ncbi:alpha/beta-hydrolase family protein [Actinoplanes sp. M2I2]|uniref:alpha/beta hydrolase n=1 Tax=Actinoplanes sp. M2I2 TaxID=1734444 RepID=UPI0020223E26|nr:alpha/beta-hydrolase family protein [Actinoplanes sp. M2I2]